jgi:hypothetical protein
MCKSIDIYPCQCLDFSDIQLSVELYKLFIGVTTLVSDQLNDYIE